METCVITARFTRNLRPVGGCVLFTPNRLWVVYDGTTWACLAPHIKLAPDGSFIAEVTPTDTDVVSWAYQVDTPAGTFELAVPYRSEPYTLRELVDGDHSGAGTPQ